MSDRELIERLTAFPADNKLHEYFFNVKCRDLLKYISIAIYNEENSDTIVGEFYEYISNDNWKVLRSWEGKNGCTLYSYLSTCSTRYFVAKRNAEKHRNEVEASLSIPEIVENINRITADEENEYPPVWEAYKMLNERDRTIIRLLVIEENEIMAVAPDIWRYIRSSRPYSELTQKQIQSTISMAKHRALLALLENANRLIRD